MQLCADAACLKAPLGFALTAVCVACMYMRPPLGASQRYNTLLSFMCCAMRCYAGVQVALSLLPDLESVWLVSALGAAMSLGER